MSASRDVRTGETDFARALRLIADESVPLSAYERTLWCDVAPALFYGALLCAFMHWLTGYGRRRIWTTTVIA